MKEQTTEYKENIKFEKQLLKKYVLKSVHFLVCCLIFKYLILGSFIREENVGHFGNRDMQPYIKLEVNHKGYTNLKHETPVHIGLYHTGHISR